MEIDGNKFKKWKQCLWMLWIEIGGNRWKQLETRGKIQKQIEIDRNRWKEMKVDGNRWIQIVYK